MSDINPIRVLALHAALSVATDECDVWSLLRNCQRIEKYLLGSRKVEIREAPEESGESRILNDEQLSKIYESYGRRT